MNCPKNCGNEGLLTAAAALSIALSQGKTTEELALLGLFFTVVGDNLSLLSLRTTNDDPCKKGTA